MRSVPTFLSIAAVIWAAAAALKADVPWPVNAYVISQAVFALTSWWVLQKSAAETRAYSAVFSLGFFMVLGFALLATAAFLEAFPGWLAVLAVAACGLQALVLHTIIGWRLEGLYDHIPHTILSLNWQATLLSFEGSLTLLTLFAPMKPSMRIAAACLGGFWWALGAFVFAYALNVKLFPQTDIWDDLNFYVPMMLATAAFGSLAFYFGKLQGEGAMEVIHAIN